MPLCPLSVSAFHAAARNNDITKYEAPGADLARARFVSIIAFL